MKSLIGYSIDFLDHNIIIDDYENPNFNIYHSIKNLYSFGSGYTTNHLNFVPTTLKTKVFSLMMKKFYILINLVLMKN